jgi:zinc/manganese transport system permease protein
MFDLIAGDLFRNAAAAGTIAAATAALVGYFLVLRAQAFAGEALTDICFAGSAGSALAGFNPLLGMLAFSLAGALGLGALSDRARGRDVEIGMTLSMATGLGVLFVGLYARSSASHATAGMSLLFGSILSVRPAEIGLMLVCAVLVVVALAAISRPLFFATVDPAGARAKGLPMSLLSISFMLILAVAVAMCVLTIGALLALSLLVAPPAAALRLARRPARAIALSVALGLLVVWGGLFASFAGPWRHPPAGFSISCLGAIVYFSAFAAGKRRRRRAARDGGHPSREVADDGRRRHE